VSAWAGIDERDDHYLGLAGANVVATEALLVLRDNLADVVAAKAMMCVHGDAGLGKTLSVNASLRALAPADVCRVQFRARPTPRDIRHVLFDALAISGTPPTRPIEFDALLKTPCPNGSGSWSAMRRNGCRGSVLSCGGICGTTAAPISRSCSSAAGTATGSCAGNQPGQIHHRLLAP
jgi:hypothetical protein